MHLLKMPAFEYASFLFHQHLSYKFGFPCSRQPNLGSVIRIQLLYPHSKTQSPILFPISVLILHWRFVQAANSAFSEVSVPELYLCLPFRDKR